MSLLVFVCPPLQPNHFFLGHNCLLANNTVHCTPVSRKKKSGRCRNINTYRMANFGTSHSTLYRAVYNQYVEHCSRKLFDKSIDPISLTMANPTSLTVGRQKRKQHKPWEPILQCCKRVVGSVLKRGGTPILPRCWD